MSTTEKRLITLRESDALRAMPAMNPQALLAAAIEKGAGVETLERLVALATTLRAVTAQEAYHEAISEFQRRCPPIKKNKTMAVPGRPTYRYADLGEILPTIAPLMGELGLSVSWRTPSTVSAGAVGQICRISHKLGHSEESGPCEIPYRSDGRMNAGQAVGSAMTYAKRYSLCSVLGISPEDDDDATGTDVNGARVPKNAVERNAQAAEAEAQDEAEQLFPDPEKERLVSECGTLIKAALVGKRITQKDVRAMKLTYLGAEDADPTKCDTSALSDLRKYLAARFESASA